MKRFRNINLEIAVFVGGAVVMIYEFVGARVLAPYLGTALPVWASLIGVILGSLSLGYYLGGRLADRRAKAAVLSFIFLSAAIAVFLTALVKDPVLRAITGYFIDPRLGGPLAALLLFSPPSILLGLVSPYATRLRLDRIEHGGRTVGSIYAISTAGSIAGTFLAGFWLVPFFGTTNIFYILCLLLLIVSFLLWPRGQLLARLVFIVFILLALYSHSVNSQARAAAGFWEFDTRYNRLWITDGVHSESGRPMRSLQNDPYGVQGAVYLDDPDELVFDNLRFFRLARHFGREKGRGALIGGGTYSFPPDFLSWHPENEMDVIELDPGFTELAREFFFFEDDERINIIHQDGRTWLNRCRAQEYGAIFVDAFNSRISIPFQLATQEAVRRIHDCLDEDGLALVNMVSSLKGENSRFLRAETRTYQSIFPQVYIFAVHDTEDEYLVQNVVLLGLKDESRAEFFSPDKELQDYLSRVYLEPIELDRPVLTDELAPVDYYTWGLFE